MALIKAAPLAALATCTHSTARREPSVGNTARAGTPTDIARIGSTIYAASFVDEMIALNLANGNLRWKFATGTPNPDCTLPPAPVVVGDRVFYAGLDGILYGLDGQSGKLLWKHDLGRRATTKLSVIGNSLYIGNATNRLFRISADDGHVQSELSVPAFPEGRILVDTPALYIFLENPDLLCELSPKSAGSVADGSYRLKGSKDSANRRATGSIAKSTPLNG